MDVIVNEVYDISRFKWFFHLKYGYKLSTGEEIARIINTNGIDYSLKDLTEVEVRYLQALKICKLKIINLSKMPLKRKRNIPPYLDNEGKLSETIDISPSCDNEPQRSSFELYSVTYTKVIENKEALNMYQITALLNDPNVKSINIKK